MKVAVAVSGPTREGLKTKISVQFCAAAENTLLSQLPDAEKSVFGAGAFATMVGAAMVCVEVNVLAVTVNDWELVDPRLVDGNVTDSAEGVYPIC